MALKNILNTKEWYSLGDSYDKGGFTHIVVYDIESHVDNTVKDKEIHTAILYIARHLIINRRDNSIISESQPIITKTAKDLVLKLKQLTQGAYNLYLYAHNHQYDLNTPDKTGLSLTDIFVADGFKTTKQINKGIGWWQGTWNGLKNVKFLDSMNYYNMGLSKLGATKGEVDFYTMPKTKDEWDQWIKYCLDDVDVLKKAILRFFQELPDTNPQITVSALAFQKFIKEYMHGDIWQDTSYSEFEGSSIFGARTELYKKVKKEDNIFLYSYDVNSLYPAMALKALPYNTDPIMPMTDYIYNVKEIDEVVNILIERRVGVIAEVEVYVPEEEKFPLIPLRQTVDKGVVEEVATIFPTGHFKTVLSPPEFFKAHKLGYIIGIKDICTYELAYVTRDYILDIYEKRKESKKNGDELGNHLYKHLMNNLIGGFAKKISNQKVLKNIEIEGNQMWDTKSASGEGSNVKKVGGVVIEVGEREYDKNIMPSITSHVNSYARVFMWEVLNMIGWGNVYYTDTDSVKVNEEGKRRLEESGLIDPTGLELGKFTYEPENSGIYEIFGIKRYTVYDTEGNIKSTAHKGVINNNKYLGNGKYKEFNIDGYRFSQKVNNTNTVYSNEKIIDLFEKDSGRVDIYNRIKGKDDWYYPRHMDNPTMILKTPKESDTGDINDPIQEPTESINQSTQEIIDRKENNLSWNASV